MTQTQRQESEMLSNSTGNQGFCLIAAEKKNADFNVNGNGNVRERGINNKGIKWLLSSGGKGGEGGRFELRVDLDRRIRLGIR